MKSKMVAGYNHANTRLKTLVLKIRTRKLRAIQIVYYTGSKEGLLPGTGRSSNRCDVTIGYQNRLFVRFQSIFTSVTKWIQL